LLGAFAKCFIFAGGGGAGGGGGGGGERLSHQKVENAHRLT